MVEKSRSRPYILITFYGLENPYHLQFVLVKSPKGTSIFATTDFTLIGKDAVETYALRFQIEM